MRTKYLNYKPHSYCRHSPMSSWWPRQTRLRGTHLFITKTTDFNFIKNTRYNTDLSKHYLPLISPSWNVLRIWNWRHGRRLERMTSYQKSGNRRVFSWRTILPNFIPARFETTEPWSHLKRSPNKKKKKKKKKKNNNNNNNKKNNKKNNMSSNVGTAPGPKLGD